ncbi:FKBP-type peptidyl-prolyl cis-trans isomerase [Patescibacteria group bacterium]|nr:MAG: FKBP-type peptidyl-prolyl cis-trans isomerase [Patescibacteria group bacterium]
MFGTSLIQIPQDSASLSTEGAIDQASVEVETQPVQNTNTQTTKPMSKEIVTKEGLKYTDVTIGTGAVATAGKDVTVHYTGTLVNGTKFDSSVDRGEPFTFLLGSGQVIKGWDLGVVGMKVGGKRKLVIPATLAYGPNDYGPIPGNSTLLFDVELLGVAK